MMTSGSKKQGVENKDSRSVRPEDFILILSEEMAAFMHEIYGRLEKEQQR